MEGTRAPVSPRSSRLLRGVASGEAAVYAAKAPCGTARLGQAVRSVKLRDAILFTESDNQRRQYSRAERGQTDLLQGSANTTAAVIGGRGGADNGTEKWNAAVQCPLRPPATLQVVTARSAV